jgi:hypothetical protein
VTPVHSTGNINIGYPLKLLPSDLLISPYVATTNPERGNPHEEWILREKGELRQ